MGAARSADCEEPVLSRQTCEIQRCDLKELHQTHLQGPNCEVPRCDLKELHETHLQGQCPSCAEKTELQKRKEALKLSRLNSIHMGRTSSKGDRTSSKGDPNTEADLGSERIDDAGQAESMDFAVKALRLGDMTKSFMGLGPSLNNDYFGPPIITMTAKGADEDLVFGAMRGELKRVRRALSCKASVTQINPRGLTPLMLAVTSSSGEAVETAAELLRSRSDIKARDHNGWTCLHHAVRSGKTEMAKHLLKSNGEPTWLTADGRNLIMLAILDRKVELVKMLLNWRGHLGSMVAEKDYAGNTALHFAAKEGQVPILKLLLDTNAKLHSKDTEGRDALVWACRYNNLECVKCLVKQKADINQKCKNLNTPLMYACLAGSDTIAEFLFKKQGNPNSKCGDGTPLEIADEMQLVQFKLALKAKRLQETLDVED